MHVRSTIIDGDPRRLDEAIDFVRDTVVPALSRLDGSQGLSMLVNRSTGRSITSTAWATEAAMRDSLEPLSTVRAQAARIVGGDAVVEQWEVAERARVRAPEPGFFSRSTRVTLAPGDVDLLIDTYRTSSLPALSLLPGYCAALLLVDRERGKAVSTVTFDSREHMEESRRQAASIRQSSIEKAHAEATEVTENQLVIAGITPPED